MIENLIFILAEDKGEEEGEEDGQEEQPDGGVPPTGREVTEDLEAAASVAASMAALLTNGGEDAGADLAAVALGEEGTGLDGDLIGAENSRPITPGDSAAEDGAGMAINFFPVTLNEICVSNNSL